MGFNPRASPSPTKPHKETFAYRRQPRFTSTKTTRSKRSRPTRAPTPQPKCPPNNYIPHHRNLGLKPGASDADIKAAWRKLSLRLHPDKIRDPSQRAVAQKAMILVNNSYEELYKAREGVGDSVYRWVENRMQGSTIDDSERARREAEAISCRAFVKRKPWFREYTERDEKWQVEGWWSELFWVNAVHRVVDGVLPRGWSDQIWELDGGWRVRGENGTKERFDNLNFYGPCYVVYTVSLSKAKVEVEEPKWSYYMDTKCSETPLVPGMGDTMLIQTIVVLWLVTCVLFWRKQIAWVAGRWWALCVLWPYSVWWSYMRSMWRMLTRPFRWANDGSWWQLVLGWAILFRIYVLPFNILMMVWNGWTEDLKRQEEFRTRQ